MPRLAALFVTLALALPAQGRERYAVLPMEATRGVDAQLAEVLEEVLLGELAKHGEVLGNRDLAKLLQAERQRELVGCDEKADCLAEIAGALGGATIVSSSIGRVGESWVVSLKLMNPAKALVISRATEILSGKEDGLPGAVSRAAAKLFASAPAATVAEAPAPRPPLDGKSFAAAFLSPQECEKAAREEASRDPDRGWTALRACVARGRFPRGTFTLLRALVAEAWRGELARRPDAPALLARLVALRGGDVAGDLRILRDARIPLFSLENALEQPDAYKGRLLLVRARIERIDAAKGRPLAYLEEATLRTTGDGYGSYDTANVSVRTNRRAAGRLKAADPFLDLRRDYVFLLKFEGIQDGPDGRELPSGAVEEYFAPEANLQE